MILSQYKDGSDLTIMNTFYQYGTKDSDGNRIQDFLALVYKDNKTGQKKHEIIFKPDYTFYIAKEGAIKFDKSKLDISSANPDVPHYLFLDTNKLDQVTVEYDKLDKEAAKLTGTIDFYNNNIANGCRGENRKIHTDPRLFNSDMNIEDQYRYLFGKRFTNNIEKLRKSFFDIEVDGRYSMHDFPELGECPVNAIAFHDERTDVIYQFLLRNNKNPLIQEYEDEITSGRFGYEQIKSFIRDAIGGDKQLRRYKLDKTKFCISFYDNEVELLMSFFSKVHELQPDFTEGWNSSAFDLSYIIERIKNLGYEPADIMCDQTWEVKVVNNYVDQKNFSQLAERGDSTFISGNTVWIDQEIQYASRRKSKIGSFKSFKLDDIGHDVAKVKKLDYSHITTNISMLPYLDFKTFSLYNIFDVIVQKCIELKSQDLEYIFAKCVVNNTTYKKGHRQTVYLINRMNKEWDKLGYTMGNNANKWNEKPDKFLGALVGDPLHTNAFAKMKLNGIPIFVCENLQDND